MLSQELEEMFTLAEVQEQNIPLQIQDHVLGNSTLLLMTMFGLVLEVQVVTMMVTVLTATVVLVSTQVIRICSRKVVENN